MTPERALAIAINKRLATTASLDELRDLAHFAGVAARMFDDLRMALEMAKAQGCAIHTDSLLAWLDQNRGQLARATFVLNTEPHPTSLPVQTSEPHP